MKKPAHPLTLAFFAVAAVFAAGLLQSVLAILEFSALAGQNQPAPFVERSRNAALLQALVSVGAPLGTFLGLGTLIELVDQIRWNALPLEQRVAKPTFLSFFKRLRP